MAAEDSMLEDLLGDFENELNAKALERKGKHAISSARVAGIVYTDAVSSGVPADLAQEMAAEFWSSVMDIPYAVVEESSGTAAEDSAD
ncbi:hypothetical protein AB0E21_05320 [Streptomyces sp. NPDC047967]|uniref:hypothetical protein n=1 Tax=Streptomyces sp. NPDC047967 TaxID=3154924 RepID=UPI0033D079DE